MQCTMYRKLLSAPSSVPKPILRFDFGTLSVLERININKLMFLYFLRFSDADSLSKIVLDIQIKYNFKGLITESRDLLRVYNLPNIIDDESIVISKKKWKSLVREAVIKKSEEDLKQEFLSYSKLKDDKFQDEALSLKDYLKYMNIEDARAFFKIRSSSFPFKMNMKSDPKFAEENWRCDFCFSSNPQSLSPETSNHILWCPAYAPLRENLSLDDDQHVAQYFRSVLKLREEEAMKKIKM